MQAIGVEFLPCTENGTPLFTPPHTHPVVPQSVASPYEDVTLEASLQIDASALSLEEMQNARDIGDVLTEMLSALDPHNPRVGS
ncbi:uncharacterized protein A4U43_C05F6810 [Asparagus officinalis]|uniref:Uncharacterized protein n=1 Tax=Asparagus officinalis TaxID=4686 RepID=A0A5P1EQX0_ASPOF|nr:uncharacterized protein A4U43_C05F6810 [Asparagus officinalis]